MKNRKNKNPRHDVECINSWPGFLCYNTIKNEKLCQVKISRFTPWNKIRTIFHGVKQRIQISGLSAL